MFEKVPFKTHMKLKAVGRYLGRGVIEPVGEITMVELGYKIL